MKNNYKDKRDNTYGKFKRFSEALRHRYHRSDMSWEEWEEYDALFEQMRKDCKLDWEANYDEWCRYVRSLGQSNHSKPNCKHNRLAHRKIYGNTGESKYRKFSSKLDDMLDEVDDFRNPQLSEFGEKELQAERDWILDVFDTSDYDKTSI